MVVSLGVQQVVVPEHKPMAFAGEAVSDNILKLMKDRGIDYLSGPQFVAASEQGLTFNTAEGNGKASKVSGDFYGSEVDMNDAGVMNQWMKQLQERSWFVQNF
jgi:hypothetical protein